MFEYENFSGSKKILGPKKLGFKYFLDQKIITKQIFLHDIKLGGIIFFGKFFAVDFCWPWKTMCLLPLV